MKQLLFFTTALMASALFLSACDGGVSQNSPAISSDPSQHTDDGYGQGNEPNDRETDVIKMSDAAAQEAGIIVSRAELAPLDQSISLPAEIRFDADRIANVSPRVSGIIAKLYASEGDVVKRGDTLALISSRELAGLKATWLKAQTQATLAATALAREEKLFSEKITAEADVEAARANFEAINAAKDAAENELHAAGVSDAALERVATADDGDNANSYLSAPIGGTVVRRDVTLGETVSAGDAGSVTLFTIADDSVVWADIAVYKQDLSRIQKQAAVVIKSDDGTVLSQSNVAFILPIINETSRTATARVVLENPAGDLRPGQFVTAHISVGQSQPVLRVPLGAVQTVENKASVFVPIQGGFEPRPVTLGADSGDYVEIVSGLRAGDRFVSSGAFTLKAQLEKDAFGGDHDH